MGYFLRRTGFFIATLWAAITLNFLIRGCNPATPPRPWSVAYREV